MVTYINEKIAKMTAILVEGLRPMRIIIFGSYATGTTRPDSDVDILLVMENGTHRRKAIVKAYQVLGAQGIAKDIVVVTDEDIEKFGSLPGTIIGPALAEGKVVYERAA
jgi:predicted nucleotidyltransferase